MGYRYWSSRLSTFDAVQNWYERTKPVVSKIHKREDDIRPLGNRSAQVGAHREDQQQLLRTARGVGCRWHWLPWRAESREAALVEKTSDALRPSCGSATPRQAKSS
jgi:hypothetical protein